MDQLDLLKKDWKKQDASLPKYSQSELSKLIHKKSSSIVKWIFIISILELVIPNLISLISGAGNGFSLKVSDEYEIEGLQTFIIAIYAISYIVSFYFIYRFYMNYKAISANSTTKDLMQNIIKTRKTVKYYMWSVISMATVFSMVVFYKIFTSETVIEQLPENTNMVYIWVLIAFLTLITLAIIWGLYTLLYGILLRKLKMNYNELVKDSNLQNI